MGNEMIRGIQKLPDGRMIIDYGGRRYQIVGGIDAPALPSQRALESYVPRPVVEEPPPFMHPVMHPLAYPYQPPVYVQHEPPRVIERPRRRNRNRFVAAKAIAMVALSLIPTFLIKDGHGFWMTFLGWILIFAWLVGQASKE